MTGSRIVFFLKSQIDKDTWHVLRRIQKYCDCEHQLACEHKQFKADLDNEHTNGEHT